MTMPPLGPPMGPPQGSNPYPPGQPMGQPSGDGFYAPVAPESQKSILGLIAISTAVVGFIFACIPGALIVGWVLLPIALILGIVGLFQHGTPKGTSIAAIIVAILGTIVGVVVFFTVVTDAVDDAFSEAFGGSDLSASEPAKPDGAPSDNEGDKTAGSREDPLAIGETVTNDDWEIVLGAPREAWAEVSAENQFNDAPKAGMEYWIVPVTATYIGDETGTAWVETTIKFVGSDNKTYGDRCGVIPDDLSDVDELYPGGVAEGNTCVMIPAGADGLWTLSTGFSGKPSFFAID